MAGINFSIDTLAASAVVRPRRAIADAPAAPQTLATRRVDGARLVADGPANLSHPPTLLQAIEQAWLRLVKGESSNQPTPHRLAEELRQSLRAQRVVLAAGEKADHKPPVIALTGATADDFRSDWRQLLEDAARDTAWSQECRVWSASHSTSDTPVLRRLAIACQATTVVALPIPHETLVGAALLIAPQNLPTDADQGVAAGKMLGEMLRVVLSAERGSRPTLWQRIRRRLAGAWLSWVAGGAAVLAGVLAIPLPYHVNCETTLEPHSRVLLAAPFAGTLETTAVEPGDEVVAGQTLAQMDGRPLRLEIATLDAEIKEAEKRQHAALAARQGAAALVARLELEQLTFKRATLDRRQQQLEIKSTLDGVILRGDLRRVQGAPLQAGQTLFEVAALDVLRAEIAIPEEEVAFVREGQPVRLRWEAFPGRVTEGKITRLHPRAELRENHAVFIAEAELAGELPTLRPGMRARAQIATDSSPLAWNLLRRPWAYLSRWGW